MELISEIPIFGGFISTIIAFVGVLGIVVFVHEYGHYIVGRWSGIHAEVFSMGFGPVIWSRRDKRGTKWQVSAIPIGGYVKFLGDRNAASVADEDAVANMPDHERDRSFPTAKLYKRILTILAGPVANFILSTVIFTGLILWHGVASEKPLVGEMLTFPEGVYTLQKGDEILTIEGQKVTDFSEVYQISSEMNPPSDMNILVLRDGVEKQVLSPYLFPPAVYAVSPMSAASRAGFRKGDIILNLADVPITTFSDLVDVVENAADREITAVIWRDGHERELQITPVTVEFQNSEGGFDKRVMIGISGAPAFLPLTQTPNVFQAVTMGVTRVGDVISGTFNALKHIFLGNLSASNLQGPLGIAQISKEAANQGVVMFLSLVALISTGIGMFNLFPIPMLDGGHLVFYSIEAIRGRPLGNKTIQISVSIGLATVLLLMVFVTYNDILRL
ncbi:MAG: RIP metalloprotease RseP [Paracoccaceae bacterium]